MLNQKKLKFTKMKLNISNVADGNPVLQFKSDSLTVLHNHLHSECVCIFLQHVGF